MEYSEAQKGANRSVSTISEKHSQKSQPFDTKTPLRDIPSKILNELEFWEVELLKIIERVNEKTRKNREQTKGDKKHDRLA